MGVCVCVCGCSHVTWQGNSFIFILPTLLRQFVATESMKLTGPISRISTWGIAFNCIEEEEVAVLPSCGSSFRPRVTAWVLKANVTRGQDFHLAWMGWWEGYLSAFIWLQPFSFARLFQNHTELCWCWSKAFLSLHLPQSPCLSVTTCLISEKTCSELAK